MAGNGGIGAQKTTGFGQNLPAMPLMLAGQTLHQAFRITGGNDFKRRLPTNFRNQSVRQEAIGLIRNRPRKEYFPGNGTAHVGINAVQPGHVLKGKNQHPLRVVQIAFQSRNRPRTGTSHQ